MQFAHTATGPLGMEPSASTQDGRFVLVRRYKLGAGERSRAATSGSPYGVFDRITGRYTKAATLSVAACVVHVRSTGTEFAPWFPGRPAAPAVQWFPCADVTPSDEQLLWALGPCGK